MIVQLNRFPKVPYETTADDNFPKQLAIRTAQLVVVEVISFSFYQTQASLLSRGSP